MTNDIDIDKQTKLQTSSLIMAKPGILLQEEADNWGILYNSETDFSFGINPVSVFIWKQMKNKTTVDELSIKVRKNCTGVPGEVEKHIIQFIEKLLEKDLASLENA